MLVKTDPADDDGVAIHLTWEEIPRFCYSKYP